MQGKPAVIETDHRIPHAHTHTHTFTFESFKTRKQIIPDKNNTKKYQTNLILCNVA